MALPISLLSSIQQRRMMYSAKSEPTKADSVTADGLSRFYYLDNFQHVLRYVLQQYRDLLNTAEIDYGEHFLALNRPHQALLVRLYSRQGPCIRSDKLNYRNYANGHGA
ncbi:MAG: hypothetical protein IPM37_22910 [Hahellaceae bacterium]|nr:hypothetical protein [Hahellaceae bacterium]